VTPELIKAIAVTAELTGTQLSEAAAKIFAADLSQYPLPQVLAALTRCRREVKGRLVLADVISRIDDGRPGVEEAWAMIPKNEDVSAVWTQEMQAAMLVAGPLLYEDAVAARMAFKEAYTRECQKARDSGVPVKWQATLGFSQAGREEAQHEAKNRNLISQGLPALPFKAAEHSLPAPRRSLQLVGPEGIGEIVERMATQSPRAREEFAKLKEQLKSK
jgi:hypothetical protein